MWLMNLRSCSNLHLVGAWRRRKGEAELGEGRGGTGYEDGGEGKMSWERERGVGQGKLSGGGEKGRGWGNGEWSTGLTRFDDLLNHHDVLVKVTLQASSG